MDRQEQEYRHQLKIALERIKKLEIRQLTREEELGSQLGFSELEDELQRAIDLGARVGTLPLESLPAEPLNDLQRGFTALADKLQSFLDFDPSQQDVQDARSRVIKEFRQTYSSTYRDLAPTLGCQAALYSRDEQAFDRLLIDAREAVSEVDEMRSEAQKALDAIRATAGESGVASYSNIFEKQADKYRHWGYAWLAVTALAGALTVAAASLNLFWLVEQEAGTDPSIPVQRVAAKLILFSALSFTVVWAARNYRAHRHNEVVNRHRHNALETFEAFVAATEDREIQDAILLRATQTVFGPERSGYLGKGDAGSGSAPILEIARRVASSSDDA